MISIWNMIHCCRFKCSLSPHEFSFTSCLELMTFCNKVNEKWFGKNVMILPSEFDTFELYGWPFNVPRSCVSCNRVNIQCVLITVSQSQPLSSCQVHKKNMLRYFKRVNSNCIIYCDKGRPVKSLWKYNDTVQYVQVYRSIVCCLGLSFSLWYFY